jgi:hypothetical protein
MATVKQKKAIANLVENGGNVSRAMIDAGYSPATANTPQKLTESEAFKSIAEQIPDDLLVKVHLEGLNAKQFRYSPEGELMQLDDFATRHKYLESAYKIKKIMDGDGAKIFIQAVDVIFKSSNEANG